MLNKKHTILTFLLGGLLLFLLILPALSKDIKTIEGTVIKVKDGDTVVIAPLEGGQFFTCRLYGIDAPETEKPGKPGQPYGEEAMKYLKKLVLGQTVRVTTTGDKTYNREVCIIYRDSMNVNLEMVKAGYAWAYRQYLKRPYASEYIDAETEARQARRGLWQEINPTPPWEWRKTTKKNNFHLW